MRIPELKALLKRRIEAGNTRPLSLVSAPGAGKTTSCQQVAAELDIPCILLHAPTLSPEDIAIPMPVKGRLQFALDAQLPIKGEAGPSQGIIVIDELAAGSTEVQKLAATMFQDRIIKGHRIKDGWTFVATGNRQEDRAGASRVLTHLANRMTSVNLDVNLDDWCNWYIEQSFCKAELLSFLRFKPNFLMDFDPNRKVNPTPRSWVEGVGRSMDEVTSDTMMETFAGDVGDGYASEFCSFLKIWRALPNPDVVLLNPDKHPVPEETSVRYALAGALSMRATQDNFGRVMTFASRMPPEFTVILVRDAMARDPRISETPAFIKWAQKEGAALLS